MAPASRCVNGNLANSPRQAPRLKRGVLTEDPKPPFSSAPTIFSRKDRLFT